MICDLILNTVFGMLVTGGVAMLVGTETNVKLDFLWIGNWMRHIRSCHFLKDMSDSFKVRLGWLVTLLWILLWVTLGTFWFIVIPYLIYRAISLVIKKYVGVES